MTVRDEYAENCTFNWTLYKESKKESESETTYEHVSKADLNVTADGSSLYGKSVEETGNYRLKVKVTPEEGTSEEIYWDIVINPENYASGDRIWREGQSSENFTWDYLSFSGFYYDVDSGDGTEKMMLKQPGLNGSARKIKEGNLVYRTESTTKEFECSRWGSYEVVGFMADKYFGGYTDKTSSAFTKADLISDGYLLKVLVDNDEKHNVKVGQTLLLEEDFSIRVADIDVNGDKVRLEVLKDGESYGSATVKSGQTAVFDEKVSGSDKVTVLAVYVDSVFQGMESSMVTIEGIFQLSDSPVRIDEGKTFDKMEVTEYGKTGDSDKYFIEMENKKDISLSKGGNVTIMGNLYFDVADSTTLRFAPTVKHSDGSYEIRGSVYDPAAGSEVTKWTPYNFEGMYYDIDSDDETTETLELVNWNGEKTIANGSLIYTSKTVETDFERSKWGTYQVISITGAKYFAGYTKNSTFSSKTYSLLSDGYLCEVLTDNEDKRNVKVGQSLQIGDGYTIKIDDIDINGDKVRIEVFKDGESVSSATGKSGQTLTFEKKIGDEKIPIIAVYVDSVFQGMESSMVTIEGIFQISDTPLKVEEGEKYDKMEITSLSDTQIEFENKNKISLSGGKKTSFLKMGNLTLYFRAGDSSELRFYPYTIRTSGASGGSGDDEDDVNGTVMTLTVSPSTVNVGDTTTVTARSGSVNVSGVIVKINDTSIGTTGSGGTLTYTPTEAGTFRLTGTKSGYRKATADLTVRSDRKTMIVSVSPSRPYAGEEFIITVVDSGNSRAISDASVNVSGDVRRTDSSGQARFMMGSPGNYSAEISADGYTDYTTQITVKEKAAEFDASDFKVTGTPKTGIRSKLSFSVKNTGVVDGTAAVRVVVEDEKGTVYDKTTIKTIASGETVTFTDTFRPAHTGTAYVNVYINDESVTTIPEDIRILTVEKGGFFEKIIDRIKSIFGK